MDSLSLSLALSKIAEDIAVRQTKPLTQQMLKAWVRSAFLKEDEDGNKILKFPKRTLVHDADASKLPASLRTLRGHEHAIYKLDAHGNTVYAAVPSVALFSTADFYDKAGAKLNGAWIDEMSNKLFWEKKNGLPVSALAAVDLRVEERAEILPGPSAQKLLEVLGADRL